MKLISTVFFVLFLGACGWTSLVADDSLSETYLHSCECSQDMLDKTKCAAGQVCAVGCEEDATQIIFGTPQCHKSCRLMVDCINEPAPPGMGSACRAVDDYNPSAGGYCT